MSCESRTVVQGLVWSNILSKALIKCFLLHMFRLREEFKIVAYFKLMFWSFDNTKLILIWGRCSGKNQLTLTHPMWANWQWLLDTFLVSNWKSGNKGHQLGRGVVSLCAGSESRSWHSCNHPGCHPTYKRLSSDNHSSLQLCTPVGSGIKMQRFLVSEISNSKWEPNE